MDLGWKLLIPLSLAWILLLAAVRLADEQDWNLVAVGGGVIVMFLVGWGLLRSANAKAKAIHQNEEVPV